MTASRIAGLVYAVLASAVVSFQVALALGAPWGEYAMGGVASGTIPPAMRGAVLLQAVIVLVTAVVVACRAGLVLPSLAPIARRLVWVAVVILLLSLAGNLASPSAGERALWVPVLLLMVATSIFVAVSGRGTAVRDEGRHRRL